MASSYEDQRTERLAELRRLEADAQDLQATILFEDVKVGIGECERLQQAVVDLAPLVRETDEIADRSTRHHANGRLTAQLGVFEARIRNVANDLWHRAVMDMRQLAGSPEIGDEEAAHRLVDRGIVGRPNFRHELPVSEEVDDEETTS